MHGLHICKAAVVWHAGKISLEPFIRAKVIRPTLTPRSRFRGLLSLPSAPWSLYSLMGDVGKTKSNHEPNITEEAMRGRLAINTFPCLGSLTENQIGNKGAKALARSLLVNRSLTTLE